MDKQVRAAFGIRYGKRIFWRCSMASYFPPADFDYIGKVLSELLSKQYDADITLRFVPKEDGKETA